MRRAAIGLLAAVALGGCSLGGDDEGGDGPPGVEGRAAAVVLRLDGLIRARDYDAICDRLLTTRARARAGGARCARGMRVQTAGLTEPRLALQGVRVVGPEVRAAVRVSSEGARPGDRTVVLTRVGRSLRVDGITR